MFVYSLETYEELGNKFLAGEISLEEQLAEYNRMIAEDSGEYEEWIPHEYI